MRPMRRRIANRESARRVRQKRQEVIEDMQTQVCLGCLTSKSCQWASQARLRPTCRFWHWPHMSGLVLGRLPSCRGRMRRCWAA